MAPYIFTERNGIYIIDLQKTVRKLDEAYMFIRDLSAQGESVLFVGTKKQAGDSIKEEATRAGAYYVNARWLGGMMTNFSYHSEKNQASGTASRNGSRRYIRSVAEEGSCQAEAGN